MARSKHPRTNLSRSEKVGYPLVALAIAALAGFAFLGGGQAVVPEGGWTYTAQEVADAEEQAGCDALVVGQLEARHYEAGTAPPATELYALHPPAGGPHFVRAHPPVITDREIDVRNLMHSFEHGAAAVFYDPAEVDGPEAIEAWARSRADAGFDGRSSMGGGVGLTVAPYPDFTSGKPVALRAWGAALDCETFDQAVADGFLARSYGPRGAGPEGRMATYPDGVVEVTDAG